MSSDHPNRINGNAHVKSEPFFRYPKSILPHLHKLRAAIDHNTLAHMLNFQNMGDSGTVYCGVFTLVKTMYAPELEPTTEKIKLQIRAIVHKHMRNVQRSLDRLESLGFIEQLSQGIGGRKSVWRVVTPSAMVSVAQGDTSHVAVSVSEGDTNPDLVSVSEDVRCRYRKASGIGKPRRLVSVSQGDGYIDIKKDISNPDIHTQTRAVAGAGVDANLFPSDSSSKDNPSRSNAFAVFWESYPKDGRVDRKKCAAKWTARKLDQIADEIMAGLNRWKQSDRWTKDAGQFVCHAATFLNNDRWLESPPPARCSKASGMHEGLKL